METNATRHRVLIVDDVSAVREALRYAFEDIPELDIVGEAVNGEDAVSLTASLSPELVILDAELPLIDGFEVARKLKKLDSPPLIVFLTIYGDQASRRKASEAGADVFVEKGSGWSVLLNKIRFLLNLSET